MKRITIIFGVLIAVAVVRAVPPPPPKLDHLAKRSDLIAIVIVTNVTDHVSQEVAWQKGPRQSAVATVKRTIKGTSPNTVHFDLRRTAASDQLYPSGLATGEFLVFLRREGKDFVRTDLWYSQASIVTNQVSLLLEQPVALESAIVNIEKIVNNK